MTLVQATSKASLLILQFSYIDIFVSSSRQSCRVLIGKIRTDITKYPINGFLAIWFNTLA